MKKKSKKQRLKKPGPGPHAHGATKPPIFFEERGYPECGIQFGSTSAGADDYPVHYYGLDNITELRKWLESVESYLFHHGH